MADHETSTPGTKVVPPAQLVRELTLASRAKPRTGQRRRGRRSRLGALSALMGGGALVLAAFGSTLVSADSGSLSVEVANRQGYAQEYTADHAIVTYIGDLNESFGSSGTGVFDSFVRLQASPTEAGYNTDGTLEFNTKAGNWTHAILVSDIPVVSIGGVPYWELWSDINDSNSTPRISLNELEVYFTTDPNLTGYSFGAAATKVYDFLGSIHINDVNQGSGRGDLRYNVPTTGISIPANCGYKNPACSTYFVLYSQWGAASGTYTSDGGFEEWKVKQYPYVTVDKTAETTFTRTFPWTIDKSVTPATWNMFTGDSGTSRYTVALTKGTGVDSAWAVSGTITIDNPSGKDAVITSVADVISGFGPVSATCGVTFPYTLPDGDSLVCTYTSSLPDGTTRTNTASVVLDYGGLFTDTAAVTFGSPTTLVNDTIHVTDTYAGSLGAFSATGSTSYNQTFTCDADEGTHNNTATITETAQSDSASVTVNCYEITVAKDAATSFTRTYHWSIDKSADQTEITLLPGGTADVHYSVSVNTTGYTDSNWAVSGSITVHNPAPVAATINSVSDVISGVGAVAPSCGVSFPYSLAAGGDLVCSYTSSLPDASSRTNTATATRQNYSYSYLLVATATGTTGVSGSANVTFSATPSSEVDECITVTDTYGNATLGTACIGDVLPKTFNYTRTVGPYTSGECGDHNIDNTATFTTNDTSTTGSDSWRVIVHVPCLEGCTPGFWQGGAGITLWDEVNDQDWVDAGGDGFNPFVTTTVFGDYFAHTGTSVDTMTMLQIVGSGGTNDWALKAARDLIAAYLNSSFGIDYPYSTATILSDWSTAVAGGDAGYQTFHDKYAAANQLGCPL